MSKSVYIKSGNGALIWLEEKELTISKEADERLKRLFEQIEDEELKDVI